MKLNTIALVAVLLAAAVVAAHAQTPAAKHVEGTVVDSQGLAVVGARVTLTLATLTRTAVSSTAGFRFENLASGTYTLRVTAPGFQLQQMSIDLSTEASRTVEVRLEPAGI